MDVFVHVEVETEVRVVYPPFEQVLRPFLVTVTTEVTVDPPAGAVYVFVIVVVSFERVSFGQYSSKMGQSLPNRCDLTLLPHEVTGEPGISFVTVVVCPEPPGAVVVLVS